STPAAKRQRRLIDHAMPRTHRRDRTLRGLRPLLRIRRRRSRHAKRDLAMPLLQQAPIAPLMLEPALLQQPHGRISATRPLQATMSLLAFQHRLVPARAKVTEIRRPPALLISLEFHEGASVAPLWR